MNKFILISLSCLFFAACAKSPKSIYSNLAPDEDGVIEAEISSEDITEAADSNDKHMREEAFILSDTLTTAEKDIAAKHHNNQLSRFSFLIVDARSKNVMRSYKALQPRRLASVTKVPTAITALENVDGPSIDKIKAMLKSSNNGEASRYLRLAVKALANYIVPGNGYTQAHSCPSAVQQEEKAADLVLGWLQAEIENMDWTDSVLKDGAGCDYGNFMNAYQIIKILEYADSKGKAYKGLSFESLLSISGVDGTWANRNTDHKGMVLAKTGTLNPNANLAGYFYARRNGVMNKYYFVVFVEKDSGSANSTKARTFIESLVRHWINYYSQQPGIPIANI